MKKTGKPWTNKCSGCRKAVIVSSATPLGKWSFPISFVHCLAHLLYPIKVCANFLYSFLSPSLPCSFPSLFSSPTLPHFCHLLFPFPFPHLPLSILISSAFCKRDWLCKPVWLSTQKPFPLSQKRKDFYFFFFLSLYPQ